MKKITLFIILSIFLGTVTAQGDNFTTTDGGNKEKPSNESSLEECQFEFTDYGTAEELNSITAQEAGSHYLGEMNAKKFKLIQNLYTYQTSIGPGNPGTRTVIQKPLIYSAIHKMNKYLKKNLRKGNFSEDEANEILSHSLDVVIAAFSQNTDDFESALKQSKEPEEIVSLFQKARIVKL